MTWYYFQGNYGYNTTAIDSDLPRHDFTGGDGKVETEGIAVLQAAYVQTGIAKDVRPTTLEVTNCYAESGDGGGAYFYSTLKTAYFKGNVTFEKCYARAGKGGGAYFNNTADLTGATGITFKGCHADSTSTSNGGGGAWFNSTATLDGAVAFEDCNTSAYGGAMYFANGGTMTGVNVDGHKTLDTDTNNAVKGGAIFLANSKTLTVIGGEIKNCSASDANGGAINVGGSSAKVNFESNAVVYDNKSTKDGQSVQANMVLDQNNNITINTTANGLDRDVKIGVYVTGTMGNNATDPFKSHGTEGMSFGKYGKAASDGYEGDYRYFINDRLSTPTSGTAVEKLVRGTTGEQAGTMYWAKDDVTLTITKTVDGAMGDKTMAFAFTVSGLTADTAYAYKTFQTSNGTDYTETAGIVSPGAAVSGNLTADSNGKITFNLKHNQKIELTIPANTEAEVTEKTDNYTMKCKAFETDSTADPKTSVDIKNLPNESSAGKAVTGGKLTVEKNTTLSVTNTLEQISPTGVRHNIRLYILVLLLMLAGIGSLVMITGSRQDDE